MKETADVSNYGGEGPTEPDYSAELDGNGRRCAECAGQLQGRERKVHAGACAQQRELRLQSARRRRRRFRY